MSAAKPPQREDMIVIPRSEFETLLEQAACRGARDEDAANDIRTLRDLAGSIKIMQRTFLQTLVRWVTVGLLALLVAGIAAKGGVFHR